MRKPGGKVRAPSAGRARPLMLLLLATLAGCGADEARRPAAAELRADLLAVPAPDMSGSETAVRSQIDAQRARLDALLEDPGAQTDDLAGAYGRLGMLYHVYELDEAAEACYRNARLLDGTDPGWTYYLGMLFERRGDLEAGIAEYQKVLAGQPEDLPSLLRLGAIHLRLDRTPAAIEAYRRAVQLAPDSAAAHYGLGRAAASSGDTALAVREFERALEIQPRASRIHYPLATALRAAGELERAERHLARQGPVEVGYADQRQRRLLLLETGAAPRIDRAARLSGEGRLREAAQLYRAALQDEPGSLEARRGLASVLAIIGETGEAEEIYRGILEEHPENAVVHQRLGRVLESRAKLDEAITRYQTAHRLVPELVGIHHDLGRTLHRAGQHEAALAEYEEAVAEEPQDRAVRYERAVVLGAAGRGDEASAELSRLVGDNPDDHGFRLAVARALAGMGRIEEMIAQCRVVLAAAQATPQQRARASHNIAIARLEQGELAEADRLFRQAVSSDPELREAQIGWGRTLSALGRYGQAAERFRAAVLLQPADVFARLVEARALVAAGLERAARTRLEEAATRARRTSWRGYWRPPRTTRPETDGWRSSWRRSCWSRAVPPCMPRRSPWRWPRPASSSRPWRCSGR